MPPEKSDEVFVADMLRYARAVARTAGAVSLQVYLADDDLRMATERRVEIIGEAARGLSEEFKARHPHIPWSKIIRQRHVIAHEYGEIDDEIIWRVARDHVPELVRALGLLAGPLLWPDDVNAEDAK